MSLSYGFYNSIGGDRKYNAEQMSSLFDGIINDGVFMSIGDAMMVTAATGMQVRVGTGRAWFNHTWTHNDSDLLLTVQPAEIAFNRIDMVTLEVNSTEEVRANTIKIVKGTPAVTPVAPTPINTQFVHQHPLAFIYVGSGVTEIITANITNKVGTSDCPFVTGVLEVMDTDALLAQWGSEYQVWLTAIQNLLSGATTEKEDYFATWGDEFHTWFNDIVQILDSEVVGNLYNRIDATSEKVDNLDIVVRNNFRRIRAGATPR